MAPKPFFQSIEAELILFVEVFEKVICIEVFEFEAIAIDAQKRRCH